MKNNLIKQKERSKIKRMTINEEYAIELLLDGHLKGKEIGGKYSACYKREAQIANPAYLDKWLLNNDYLRRPAIEELLSDYEPDCLQDLLKNKGIEAAGDKNELIKKIIENIDVTVLSNELEKNSKYYLSEKGKRHYSENTDLIELHKNWKYHIPLGQYFKYRIRVSGKGNFIETAYQIYKANLRDLTIRGIAATHFNFHYFSEICEKAEKFEEALVAVIAELYIDVNLEENSYLFISELLKINGVKKMAKDIAGFNLFNIHVVDKIIKLSKYYSESIVDDLYENFQVAYVCLDKDHFKKAIEEMVNSPQFNKNYYIKIITNNYIKTAHSIIEKNPGFLTKLSGSIRG